MSMSTHLWRKALLLHEVRDVLCVHLLQAIQKASCRGAGLVQEGDALLGVVVALYGASAYAKILDHSSVTVGVRDHKLVARVTSSWTELVHRHALLNAVAGGALRVLERCSCALQVGVGLGLAAKAPEVGVLLVVVLNVQPAHRHLRRDTVAHYLGDDGTVGCPKGVRLLGLQAASAGAAPIECFGKLAHLGHDARLDAVHLVDRRARSLVDGDVDGTV